MALRASPTRPRGRWRQGLASTRKAPNRPCLWSQPASLHASTAAQKALLRTFHFNSRASSRGTDRMRVPFQLQIKLRGTDRMQSVPYQPPRHDLEGTARQCKSNPHPSMSGAIANRAWELAPTGGDISTFERRNLALHFHLAYVPGESVHRSLSRCRHHREWQRENPKALCQGADGLCNKTHRANDRGRPSPRLTLKGWR